MFIEQLKKGYFIEGDSTGVYGIISSYGKFQLLVIDNLEVNFKLIESDGDYELKLNQVYILFDSKYDNLILIIGVMNSETNQIDLWSYCYDSKKKFHLTGSDCLKNIKYFYVSKDYKIKYPIEKCIYFDPAKVSFSRSDTGKVIYIHYDDFEGILKPQKNNEIFSDPFKIKDLFVWIKQGEKFPFVKITARRFMDEMKIIITVDLKFVRVNHKIRLRKE